MTSPWGSPFKDLGSFVGAVSKTLQTAEKAIDKAIGIPPEDAAQNGKKETNTVNGTTFSDAWFHFCTCDVRIVLSIF